MKELDGNLKSVLNRLKDELKGLRSNRPSVELIEDLKVNYFDSWMNVKQLGSISINPPREVRISVWDKGAVAPVMKAVEDAQAGFTVSNEGNTIRAMLSPLSAERREELGRLVKKTAEAARIEVRSVRDEIMKKMRAAEDRKEITEDQSFSGKEKVQKRVNDTNAEIEKMQNEKIAELGE